MEGSENQETQNIQNENNQDAEVKASITLEEITKVKEKVNEIKNVANDLYKNKNYLEALNSYLLAINLLYPDYNDELPIHYITSIKEKIQSEYFSYLSTLFLNRGLSYKQLKEFKQAVDNFSKSLIFNPDNSKALFNRLDVNYKLGEFLDAQDDYTKLKSQNPKLLSELNINEHILNIKAEEKKKELTGEMLGKLKDVGNSFLGLFGMSLDNFQMNQSKEGGYNIQFKNN